ncbi:hypothetical protein AN161_04270 [Lysinibacillus sp. FJAT-14222]|nr:hypothetical protein AN161_04270 [Lysinibacillus sp. FJAT-14222]
MEYIQKNTIKRILGYAEFPLQKVCFSQLICNHTHCSQFNDAQNKLIVVKDLLMPAIRKYIKEHDYVDERSG